MPPSSPTNPMGRCFISYRRARQPEIDLLAAALRDHGIPVWQDVRDLEHAHAERRIREVLESPDLASALLWLTPDVAGSDFIRKVEIPLIFERERAGDGFHVVPVLSGGVGLHNVRRLPHPAWNDVDLRQWNLLVTPAGRGGWLRRLWPWGRSPVEPAAPRAVARRVLEHRLRAIHHWLPAGRPLRLRLSTRGEPPFEPDVALSLDWSRHFRGGRTAPPESWAECWSAIRFVAEAMHRLAPGRRVVAEGNLALPAAVMLGGAFLAERGVRIAFRVPGGRPPEAKTREASLDLSPELLPGGRIAQTAVDVLGAFLAVPPVRVTVRGPEAVPSTVGPEQQEWSIGVTPEEVPFTSGVRYDRVGAVDVAVLVSVSSRTEAAFTASRPHLPPFRAVVEVRMAEGPRYDLTTPGQAARVAELVYEAVRHAREELRPPRFHFFLAVPAGLAMLIGQRCNTLGPIQTYEHLPTDAVGRYQPAACFNPSE